MSVEKLRRTALAEPRRKVEWLIVPVHSIARTCGSCKRIVRLTDLGIRQLCVSPSGQRARRDLGFDLGGAVIAGVRLRSMGAPTSRNQQHARCSSRNSTPRG